MKYQKRVVRQFIKQQGGLYAAAKTIGVHFSTLSRYRSGQLELKGAYQEAVEAVLRHPEDYASFPANARKQGRPRKKETAPRRKPRRGKNSRGR